MAGALQFGYFMVLEAIFSLVISQAAAATTAIASSQIYTASTMTDLPALGTDRRVILSTMRHAGLKALESTGDRLVFDGGLPGWPGVSRASYSFANNALTTIELEFKRPGDDEANHALFWDVRDALAVKHGSPSFDRVRDSDKAREGVLARQKDATIWANEGVKVAIEATYGTGRALKVSVNRDAHSEYEREVASVTDNKAWAVADSSALTLSTRAVAENLFDDFGDQQTIVEGAKRKGSPINVRLKKMNLPTSLASATDAIQQRFFRFADGQFDVVKAVNGANEADVDLVIDVVPVANVATEQYQMRLSAVIAHGTRSGQVLYSATAAIQ